MYCVLRGKVRWRDVCTSGFEIAAEGISLVCLFFHVRIKLDISCDRTV